MWQRCSEPRHGNLYNCLGAWYQPQFGTRRFLGSGPGPDTSKQMAARVCSHLCTCVFTLVLRPRVCTYTLVPVCFHTCAPPPCVRSHLCSCAFTLLLRPFVCSHGRSTSVNAHVHKCEHTRGRSTSVNTHGHKCVRTHTGAEHKCEQTRAQM